MAKSSPSVLGLKTTGFRCGLELSKTKVVGQDDESLDSTTNNPKKQTNLNWIKVQGWMMMEKERSLSC